MADKKISQLTALAAANLAPSTDVLAIVDTSATETKKIVAQDLVNGVLNVASAVGIGTASPGSVGVSGYTRLVLGAGSGATDGLTIVPSGTGGVQFTDAANVKKGYLQWDSSTGALALGTAGTTKATLDASGNLLVGGTSALTSASGRGNITINGTDAVLAFGNSNSSAGYVYAASANLEISAASTRYINFLTNGTERGRFSAGGYFKASNDGTYYGSTASYHELRQTGTGVGVVVSASNASYANDIFYITASRNTTNGSFNYLVCYNDGSANFRLKIADSGNVTNVNGSYGTISDAKMKTDIVDAGSQWDDIKAVRFRKFKMKNDPTGLVQFGLVAQELEQVSPGLVDEHADRDAEGNDLGTTTKSVKTSVLLMKAAKALQEAMARIESLEADVAALKGAK